MQLTPSQAYTLNNLPKWWNCNLQVAVLQGAAGVGKTWLVKSLLDTLGTRVTPLLLAETNEAVSVLSRSVGSKYTTKTVCSALGLYLTTNGASKELKQSKLGIDLDIYNFIIVDESSMLDELRLTKLQELGKKILYVGHKSQLPPVTKNLSTYDKCVSPVFEQGHHTFNLKEPVRNKGELYQFCDEVEQLIYKRGIPTRKYIENNKFLSSYLSSINGKEDVFLGNTVMLAYHNARVDTLNSIARYNLFGVHAEEEIFIVEDKIIFREPVAGFIYPIFHTCRSISDALKQPNTVFTTNTKAVVKKVNYRLVVNIGCYELTVETDHFERGKETGIIYVAADSDELASLKHKLYCAALYDHNTISAEKKWRKYHEVSLVYGNVKHAYARTIHTAQGSTITNVIVDDKDISKCTNSSMRKKLSYVAYSRASTNLHRID